MSDEHTHSEPYANTGRLQWKRNNERNFGCFNEQQEYLGYLHYERVGAHMHWCWRQEPDVFMSPGCLEEVRKMQKRLYKGVRQ